MTALDAVQELHPVRIPMRYRFRGIDHREAVLIRGPQGWGEFSPFPDYPASATARWLASALEAACDHLPEPLRERVPVNVTIPAVAPEISAALVAESGANTAKVKVGEPGQTHEEDMARVEAVRAALGPQGKIRIDANATWDLRTATDYIESLSRFGLEYAEQPVRTIEDMAELRKRTEVPLAADELVRLSADPLEVVDAGAADLLILKVQPMGGVDRTLDVARRAGLPVVISGAVETSVGIYPGLLVASQLPELSHACGLGTVSLLEGDPTLHPLVPEDGYLEVRRPEPDPELLRRWRPERDRAAGMLRKVRAAAEALT